MVAVRRCVYFCVCVCLCVCSGPGRRSAGQPTRAPSGCAPQRCGPAQDSAQETLWRRPTLPYARR
eukprot:2493791-Rhodomonas_salina.2